MTALAQAGLGLDPDALSRRLNALERGPYNSNFWSLNVKDFGAKGDGVTDDSTFVQAAITVAKASGRSLFFPAGTYLVSRSLDCTFADNQSANFVMFGEGKMRSIILGLLVEQYPIVDFTGNTRGELRDLQVLSTGATSQATATFLSAKPTIGGSRGNSVTVRDCLLQITTEGNPYAVIGAVFYNTDLSKCINTEVYGPGGATFGFTKPAGVTSKYQGISATPDSTLFSVDKCVFNGATAPALEYTGGSAISLTDTYCAIIGSGSAGAIVRVSSNNSSSGNALLARGLRTENQSSATGVPAIQWKAKSLQVVINYGQLESDSAGVMFASDAGINLSNVDVNVSGGTVGNLLSLGGGICRARISCITGTNLFGSVGDTTAANTHDVEVRGGMTKASVYAAIGGTPGLRVVQGTISYDSMYRFFVPPTDNTGLLRESGCFVQAGVATTAYAGGSGEQLVYTTTVKGAMLQSWDGNLPPGSALVDLLGSISAAAAAGGRVRVQLAQGASTIDVLDTGANVPAGAGSLRLSVKPLSVGGTNSRCYAELLLNNTGAPTGAFFNRFTNTQSAIVFNADVTINVFVTNTGSNPYTFSTMTGLLQ